MLALMVTVPVSGGHVNPCITIAWAARGRFSWRKVPKYLLAQHIGAGLAALAALVVYYDTVDQYGAHVIASYPNSLHDHTTVAYSILDYCGLILDQFLASSLLLLSFSSIVLYKLEPGPALMGLSVAGIILALGQSAGCAMNPALDFMSRLVLIMLPL